MPDPADTRVPTTPISVMHFVGTLEVGGEQQYLIRLANGLDRSKFRQAVAFTGDDELRRAFDDDISIEHVFRHRVAAHRPSDWRLIARIAHLVDRHEVDLVTTHGSGIGQLAAAIAAKLRRLPVVHTIQRPFGNQSRTERLTVRIPGLRHGVYRLTDRYVALSSYYADDQILRWKIPRHKVVLNYLGLDLTKFAPDAAIRRAVRHEYGAGDDVVVLCTVARLVPAKGVDRGIRCFARIKARLARAVYLIVGAGPEREHLGAIANELGLGDSVVFAGARTDPERVMNAADVVLQTTFNPLNGIVSIEGMAAGRPIVTIVDNAEEEKMAADTCDEQQNGLFFRTKTPQESTDKLYELLVDRDRLRQMGLASRSMAEERFDLRRHIERTQALYAELVGPGRRQPSSR